MSHKG